MQWLRKTSDNRVIPRSRSDRGNLPVGFSTGNAPKAIDRTRRLPRAVGPRNDMVVGSRVRSAVLLCCVRFRAIRKSPLQRTNERYRRGHSPRARKGPSGTPVPTRVLWRGSACPFPRGEGGFAFIAPGKGNESKDGRGTACTSDLHRTDTKAKTEDFRPHSSSAPVCALGTSPQGEARGAVVAERTLAENNLS